MVYWVMIIMICMCVVVQDSTVEARLGFIYADCKLILLMKTSWIEC